MGDADLKQLLQSPRRIATENNIKTENKIVETLEEKGFSPKKNQFFFETVMNFHLIVEILYLMVIAWGMLNLFLIRQDHVDMIWSYFFWGLAMVMIYLFRTSFFYELERIIKNRAIKFPKDENEQNKMQDLNLHSASNIYIVIEPVNKPKNMILLGTNFDSASNSLNKIENTLLKSEVIALPVLGLLVFILINVRGINKEFAALLEIIAFSLMVYLIIIVFLNFFNVRENRSPGAINNGATVLALIQFAEIIRNKKLKNSLIVIAFFNGKEENMLGTQAFLNSEMKKIKNQYNVNKKDVNVVILDRIGSKYENMRVSHEFSLWAPVFEHENLKYYIKNCAKFYDIKMEDPYFQSLKTDHIPFLIDHYNSVHISRKYQESNTKYDVIENISEENVKDTIEFLKKFISSKDDNLKFNVL